MADQNPQRTEVDDNTLGRILRCDPVAIRKYVRLGIITREPNRKFPLFQSIGNVVDYLRNMASRMGTADTMKASAALKQTQRQLAEVKLQKLNGTLLSMQEIETLWGDMAASAKWLFLTFPARVRHLLELSAEDEARIALLATSMLREVAFNGQLQLPGKDGDEDGGDEDESGDEEDDVAVTDEDLKE